MLALNRKLHRAYNRVREGNFALDGLVRLRHARQDSRHHRHRTNWGCSGANSHWIRLSDFGVRSISKCGLSVSRRAYVELNEIVRTSRTSSRLHCPLTPENKHTSLVAPAIARMKNGVMLINTSRGALLDTRRHYRGAKERQDRLPRPRCLRGGRRNLFEDRSGLILSDDVFRAAAHVSKCDHHRPPGFLHARSLIEHRWPQPSTTSQSSRTISRSRSWQADSAAAEAGATR